MTKIKKSHCETKERICSVQTPWLWLLPSEVGSLVTGMSKERQQKVWPAYLLLSEEKMGRGP